MFARLVHLATTTRTVAASIVRRTCSRWRSLTARVRQILRPRRSPANTTPANPWMERTVGDLLDTLWRDRWQHRRTASQTECVLRRYLLQPWPQGLRDIRLGELTRDQVREWHAGHHARPRMANAAVELLTQAWEAVLPDRMNPTYKLRRYPERERTRVFDDSECERFIASLGALRGVKGGVTEVAADALWTLLATGGRKMELLALRVDQVDLVAGTIRLERHKQDRQVGSKVIHLGAALSCVRRRVEVARAAGSPWVFPGKSDAGHFTDVEYAFYRVLEHAEIVITGDCVPHSLRRRFATILADLGTGTLLIGACLGQRDQRTTAIYARPSTKATGRAAAQVATAIGEVAPWERRAA
ncbi:MAG: tyrosine-type recombinase/integrase [Myxococcales bacterium]|nr:tyrosine-type recombinase/integrase [Myxococcales bacterium]